MNDQERLDTLRQPSYRRLGLAITALSLGLLSWGVGLGQIPSAKPDAPADRRGPRSSSKLDIPAFWSEMFRATKAITATDGNGTATKKSAEQPAESKKTSTAPKPEPPPDPKPDLEPWPPETLAWAGKEAGDESSANGLQMRFCWCPAGTFTMGSPMDEKDRANYERQVEVTLTRGFWLAKYETTQAQGNR